MPASSALLGRPCALVPASPFDRVVCSHAPFCFLGLFRVSSSAASRSEALETDTSGCLFLRFDTCRCATLETSGPFTGAQTAVGAARQDPLLAQVFVLFLIDFGSFLQGENKRTQEAKHAHQKPQHQVLPSVARKNGAPPPGSSVQDPAERKWRDPGQMTRGGPVLPGPPVSTCGDQYLP